MANTNQERFRTLLNGEDGEVIRKGLETSSMSEEDAETRAKNWDKVFSNLDEIVEDRMYADGSPGYSSAGLHGIQFFDATVAAMIKSYAGIFAVERSMDQPNASLPYMNLYGVRTGALITPNIGISRGFGEGDGFMSQEAVIAFVAAAEVTEFTLATTGSTAGFQNLDALPIVPGSIKISYQEAGKDTVVISDDRSGNLLAPAGFLSAATVDYALTNSPSTPSISFTVAAGRIMEDDVTLKIEFVYDTPKEQNDRIKPELEYYNASTSPVVVPYEINQVANLSAKKALGIDMRKLTLTQITDEYTKLINKRTVTQVINSAKSKTESVIDLSAFTIATSDYRTHLESFMAQLKAIDTVMAKKTEKGVNVSAFLVSLALGDLFSQLEMITTKWVVNKDISYVDDVIGYYNEIPVVRTKFIPEVSSTVAQGYAIHKTKEGQLAPLMRGIFLPLTNMTEVGSFDNPLLKSGGIFSYEGTNALTQDLTVGFQVKFGIGTKLG